MMPTATYWKLGEYGYFYGWDLYMHPRTVAEKLGERDIYVWDGNYYAINVTERLELEESGGMVRVGATHYNTIEEIRKLGEVLREIAEGK